MDNKNTDLSHIKCFALDMDGTFYLGDKIYDGSLLFIEKLKETGRQFVFLTNNSSKNRMNYVEKLRKMGLEIGLNDIVSSGHATIQYLLENHKGKSVFLLGNDALQREFQEAGIVLSSQPDMVVTAFDDSLDYGKMTTVCNLVRSGIPFIATHPDYNCPVENGFVPDIGAIHAFIHASTGRMPDKIIGKPYESIMNCAFSQTGCKASETAMVGDRLYTDIAVSQNVQGLTGILVLTGETKIEDVSNSDIKPHYIFPSLKSMIPFL